MWDLLINQWCRNCHFHGNPGLLITPDMAEDDAKAVVTDEAVDGVSNEVELVASSGNAGDNVVVLKSNPLELPMVCGLCGSQYATAKGWY